MIRAFEYRQPRVHTHVTVEFLVNGEMHSGTCTDVSEGGICALFDSALPVGSTGSVTLFHAREAYTLDATVAHLEGEQVGLTFVCDSPEDRLVSEQFVAAANGIHRIS